MAKKKSSGKSATAAEKKELARRQIWAVVLFAVGILLICLSLIRGQNLWNTLHDAIYGLFGWCGLLLGPLFIYIAVMISMDRSHSSVVGNILEAVVLISLICGITQVLGAGLPEEESFWKGITALYESGVKMKGGGLFSAIVGLPLLALFGKGPAMITIGLLIFVFGMLLTGTTLMQFFHTAYKPVKKVEEVYTQKVEELRSVAPSRPRFNIDVPVDEPKKRQRSQAKNLEEEDLDPEILPQHPVSSPKGSFNGSQRLLKAKDKLLEAAQDQPAVSKKKEDPFPQPKEEIDETDAFFEETEPASDLLKKLKIVGKDDILEEDDVTELFRQEPLPSLQIPAKPLFQEEVAVSEEQEEPQELEEPGEPETLEKPEEPEKPEKSGPVEELISRAVSGIGTEREADDLEEAEEPAEEEEKLSAWEERETGEELEDPYAYPPIHLLAESKAPLDDDVSEELKANAACLVDTLKSFGVQTRIVDISRGPAVTRYELQPSAGVKISKITGLADDIALNLASAGVRIEAPIPNKAAVGIEVPNKVVSTVSIREIIDSESFAAAPSRLTAALGRDIAGNVTLADLAKMPHVLIAGSTGSGKSVCINSIIISLLFKSSPDEVKLLMVDPKVVELGVYNGIPHLLVPVVTEPRKAAGALNWAVTEMLNRYKAFADNSVRDLKGYNALAQSREDLEPMPQIVIIIDELADLMMAAPNEVEDAICRLAQMARAAGMHLVIATQRPSVDVITGVIKANIPSRIAFAVSSQVDSRTILDSSGAEKLLGRGDMLFYPVGAAKPIRVQGCFVSDREVEQVVEFIKHGDEAEYDDQIVEEIEKHATSEKEKGKGKNNDGGGFAEEDEMLPAAIEAVVEAGQASTSLLQRRLKLGYARAARIVDELEQRGVVGPFEGSKPRQVLISRERWLEMKMNQSE